MCFMSVNGSVRAASWVWRGGGRRSYIGHIGPLVNDSDRLGYLGQVKVLGLYGQALECGERVAVDRTLSVSDR